MFRSNTSRVENSDRPWQTGTFIFVRQWSSHHSTDFEPEFGSLPMLTTALRTSGRLSRTPPTTPSLTALLDKISEEVRQTKEQYFRLMDARRAQGEDLRLLPGENLTLEGLPFTVHLLYKHEYSRLRGIKLSKGSERPKKLVAFNNTCPICLEEISSKEGRFASCGRHKMHDHCFHTYSLAFNYTQECPMCRH